MKYNLRALMLKAWELFRKLDNLSFAECLLMAESLVVRGLLAIFNLEGD